MRFAALSLALVVMALAGCNLAGDVTPPPGSAFTPPQLTAPPAETQSIEAIEPPSTGADPAAGQIIYLESCEPCHGESGLGDGSQAQSLPFAAAPLGDPVFARDKTPLAWYRAVTVGDLSRFMPGFTSLTDQQRWDVVGYALTLSKSEAGLDTGAVLFEESCSECHEAGASALDLSDPVWMASASPQLVIDSLNDEEITEHADLAAIDERDADSLADYVQTLAFSTDFAAIEPPPEEEALVVPAPSEGGVIAAQVVQGSSAETLPEDLEIVLHAFDGQSESLTISKQVDKNQEAIFDQLELVEGRLYILSADVGGIPYASEVVPHPGEGQRLDLPIMIHAISQDTRPVHVDQLHLVFDAPAEGVLRLVEVWSLSNLGDRTIAPEGETLPLEFPLPEAAANLQFESGVLGGRYLPTPRGFADQTPLRPGQGTGQLVFSIDLPYEGDFLFDQVLDYPAASVTILIPEETFVVDGEGVRDLGSRPVAGASLRNYEMGPIQSGDNLSFVIKGPSPLASLQSNEALLPWLLGLGTVIVVGFFVYRWYRPYLAERRGEEKESPPEVVDAPTDNDEKQSQLLHQIAALDDEFENGKIDEDNYQKQRSALKAQLLALMQERND